jgi:hypothetical protein
MLVAVEVGYASGAALRGVGAQIPWRLRRWDVSLYLSTRQNRSRGTFNKVGAHVVVFYFGFDAQPIVLFLTATLEPPRTSG